MTKREHVVSVKRPVLAAVVAASAVAGSFRLVDRESPRVEERPEVVAALKRLERRVADVERQLEVAALARPEPAAVTRVAEERGFTLDDAWNAYFDSFETRLDRLEERLGEVEASPIDGLRIGREGAGVTTLLFPNEDGWTEATSGMLDSRGTFKLFQMSRSAQAWNDSLRERALWLDARRAGSLRPALLEFSGDQVVEPPPSSDAPPPDSADER
jgi:hypothetical protein